MRYRAVVWLIVGIATSAAAEPDAWSITYQWSNGAVAPRYYAIHRVTVHRDGQSEIVLIRGSRTVRETFAVDAPRMSALLDYVHANGIDSGPLPPGSSSTSNPPVPGDGTCELSLAISSVTYSRPCRSSGVPALLTMIRGLIPAAVLQRLDGS